MSPARLLLALIFLLILSGSAAAFTFGPMTSNFAVVRDGQVKWATNVTIEADSLKLLADEIRIDDQRIDLEPDGAQKVQVYITRYTRDYRTFRVVMAEGARTGLNLTYTNSGNDLKIYQSGVPTHTCAVDISPCSWVLANSTDFNFSILTPIGIQQLATEQGAPPPAEAGGGGGPAPVAVENPRASDPLGELPQLPDLFPRFSAERWGAVILGGILLFNGMPRTRAFLPIFLQIPFRNDVQLFAGAVTLTLVYLTPT